MTRLASALTFLALAATALAGCVSPSAEIAPNDAIAPIDPTWWERALPFGDGHDHSDWSHHAGITTANFEVVGYDPLVTDRYGTTAKGMGCGGIGTTTEGRRIAVVHTIETEVAFIVADVTDPANPVKLGEYLMPNSVVWDATVTADGMHVLVGAYPFILSGRGLVLPPADITDVRPFQPMWRDCHGNVRAAGPEQYLPFGPAIVMIGLQDPEDPTFEDWVSQPVIGPHSVSVAEIDGTSYAMSSVTNLVHESSYYTFFEIMETPAGGKLQTLSVIPAPGVASPLLNGHVEVSMAKHPITNQVLAYLANWDQGMSIYDMTNPRVPVHVSTWMDADAGSLHTTFPLPVLWGDKHFTIAGQEVGEPEVLPSGWTYLLDTTDPANPVEVGRWTLPTKPDWDGGLQFSHHYVEIIDRMMFVSNYHGGLWAVDVADPANPLAVGVFVPDRVPEKTYEGKSFGPIVEDVFAWPDGTLTVWDNGGGIYSLRFHAANPAPPAPAWTVR